MKKLLHKMQPRTLTNCPGLLSLFCGNVPGLTTYLPLFALRFWCAKQLGVFPEVCRVHSTNKPQGWLPCGFCYAEIIRTVILFSYFKTVQKVLVLAFIVFENQLACVVFVGFIKPYLRFFERAAFFAQL